MPTESFLKNDLIHDLSEIINEKKVPHIFFALFETNYQVSVLKEALAVLKLNIEGIVSDEELLELRLEKMRPKISETESKFSYKKYTLEKFKTFCEDNKDTIVVINNNIQFFSNIANAFQKYNIDCKLYHFSSIKNSTVVNGKVKVINRMAYLNEWPWFMDIINKDMPLDKRAGFGSGQTTGSVISNGKYLHYSDIDTQYSHFKDGFRKADGYREFPEKKKYNITLVGDSRFVNAYAPTELTMATYLQKEFAEKELNYEVKNLSVMANRIQNEFAMIKNLDLDSDDIIICCDGIVGNYYKFMPSDMTLRDKIKLKVSVMKDISDYCQNKGAKLIFVHLPSISDIPNLTDLEKFIFDSYNSVYKVNGYYETVKAMCMAKGIRLLDTTLPLIKNKRTSFFIDATHFSPEGSKLIADILSKYIYEMINDENDEYIRQLTDTAYALHHKYVTESRFKGITEFVDNLKKTAEGKPQNCGAIVMNCNPFTLGHRYLIEQASRQVDYLYILAVEEDRSVFKFKDRIEMIRRGVADIKNVEVIPSGKFVISSITFPEYFEKSAKPDLKVDTTTDIEIFCSYIAPALNIKTRFVGEEPIDMVTNQYNTKMKELLPEYGLNLIEIPRKESGEAPISASRVRKLLQEKNYSEVLKLVPQTTYDYLINVLGY